MICCFTGPRAFPWKEESSQHRDVLRQLDAAILQAIELGATHFLCGNAIGVDTWAAELLIRQKETAPNALFGDCPALCQPQRKGICLLRRMPAGRLGSCGGERQMPPGGVLSARSVPGGSQRLAYRRGKPRLWRNSPHGSNGPSEGHPCLTDSLLFLIREGEIFLLIIVVTALVIVFPVFLSEFGKYLLKSLRRDVELLVHIGLQYQAAP